MKVSHYTDIEAKDAGEGTSKLTVRWLIAKETGAPNFAMRLFEMEPTGHTPLHNHPWEHEIFILEGEGVAFDGAKERAVKSGDAIFIPPNEKHQIRNNSRNIMKLLCLIPHIEK
jgi:quercetin dioxygenase-like cupin family protein